MHQVIYICRISIRKLIAAPAISNETAMLKALGRYPCQS